MNLKDLGKGVASDFKGITGNAVLEEYTSELELPEAPEMPGDVLELGDLNGKNVRIISFITGNAILNVPDWAFNAEDGDAEVLDARFTKIEGQIEEHHFDLNYKVSLGEKPVDGPHPYNRGVVYNKGYYLDEKAGVWKEFGFDGLRIRQSDWLLSGAAGVSEDGKYDASQWGIDAALTISDYTDKDYAIFLAYSCRKPINDNPWQCNDGKWVLHVVETGNINYHIPKEGAQTLDYQETDLDVSKIPNLLQQLGLSAEQVQPDLNDALLIATVQSYEYGVDEIGNIEFYVANLGNKKLENIEYEIDIGEKELVDVLDVDVPKDLEIGETGLGTITMKFKEQGKWKFPVSVVPKAQEVDTTDNFLTFNVSVGEPILVKTATDSLIEDWNREINYTIKEPFTKENIVNNGEANVFVASGTDKIRTVFGDYRGAAPTELPRAKIHFKPVISREAISRQFYASAIHIGMELLAGDKEIVKYYMEITDEVTKKVYTTPLMESNFKYFYKPKELIPDFAFCRTYSAKTIITSNVYDNLLFNEPESIIFRNQNCLEEGGKKVIPFSVGSARKEKLDGDYVVVVGHTSRKEMLIEPLGAEFYVEYIDPISQQRYRTPQNLKMQEAKMFKLENLIPSSRQIDFVNGETFRGEVFFPQSQPEVSQSLLNVLDSGQGSLTFSWNDWSAMVDLDTILVLQDAPIRFVRFQQGARGDRITDWNTYVLASWDLVHPKYYTQEVVDKDNAESKFDFVIRDITENREVYRAEDLSTDELLGAYKYKEREDKARALDYNRYGIEGWNSGILALSTISSKKPLLDFVNGHYYELYPEVVSDNKNLYAPVPKAIVFYIDAYQMMANNPLLRMRFLNMQNTPTSVISFMENNEPRIMVINVPDNLAYNPETNKIEKVDISQREIKLKELFKIGVTETSTGRLFENDGNPRGLKKDLFGEGIFKGDSAEYINDEEYIYPLFESMTMTIVPLQGIGEKELATRKTTQFNCKIGRYDGVCFRGNYGYVFNYIDEVNGFLYKITLKTSEVKNYQLIGAQNEIAQRLTIERQDSNFIVQNRNNPSLHDSVVYDILSEIDRNPIEDFELKQTFAKEISKPDKINLIYEPIEYSGGIENRGDYPLIWPLWENKRYPSENQIKIGKGVGTDERRIDNLVFVYRAKAIVRNFDDNNQIIAEKTFDFSNEETEVIDGKDREIRQGLEQGLVNIQISKWFDSLSLEEYDRYSVDVEFLETDKPNVKVASFPVVFTHRESYTGVITGKNNLYSRKIPSLGSTILGKKQIKEANVTGTTAKRIIEPSIFVGINEIPQQKLYGQWQAEEFISRGPLFTTSFVVSPTGTNIEDGEYTSAQELLNNMNGDNSDKLKETDKTYKFEVYKLNNIYDWYLSAPSNELNTLDTELQGVICYSSERLINFFDADIRSTGENFALPLYCRWGNINDLAIYTLQINTAVAESELSGIWPNNAKQQEIRTYVEDVLEQYLDWYPPTSILNTTFQAYY